MALGLGNPLHLAVLVLIVVLLFGARRLPDLGRSLGEGIREFKNSTGTEDQGDAAPTPELEQSKPATRAESVDAEVVTEKQR